MQRCSTVPLGGLVDRDSQIEKTCQNSGCVCFDDWPRLIEGEAGDGMGGIFSHTRQFQHFINFTRKFPAISILNQFRHSVEISGASVITETLPGV